MGIEILKNELDIQPVAKINHGSVINIMTNTDIDFSDVTN